MENSLTFLGIGDALLEVLLLFLLFVSVKLLPCIQHWSCDYAGTRMQKARPYGRCLIAILTKEKAWERAAGSLFDTDYHAP